MSFGGDDEQEQIRRRNERVLAQSEAQQPSGPPRLPDVRTPLRVGARTVQEGGRTARDIAGTMAENLGLAHLDLGTAEGGPARGLTYPPLRREPGQPWGPRGGPPNEVSRLVAPGTGEALDRARGLAPMTARDVARPEAPGPAAAWDPSVLSGGGYLGNAIAAYGRNPSARRSG